PPHSSVATPVLHSFPTRRSSDLRDGSVGCDVGLAAVGRTASWSGREKPVGVSPDMIRRLLSALVLLPVFLLIVIKAPAVLFTLRSEEHTSELQSLRHLVCRLLLE